MKSIRRRDILRRFHLGALLTLALLLSSCAASPEADFTALQSKTYSAANLQTLVGEKAAVYRSYRVEQVQVEEVQAKDGLTLTVETWKLADPASAYGLFTQLCTEKPLKLGNDGCGDGQNLLGFWQDDYTVILRAASSAPAGTLEAYARALLNRLPKGGQRPAVAEMAPAQNRSAAGLLYFHEEIALQARLPLDGKNRLGLSAETGGVLVGYSLDGGDAELLLIEYPDETAAAGALRALQNYGLPNLLVSGSKGRILAAVFGSASAEAAADLLVEALQ
jgi:hypothetical protein